MADPVSGDDDLRSQLDELNREIAALGGEADAAFDQVGGENVGAQDQEDVAAALTNAQENQALLQPLYEKRQRLHDQLRDAG